MFTNISIRHTITNIKSSLKKQTRLTISQTVFAR